MLFTLWQDVHETRPIYDYEQYLCQFSITYSLFQHSACEKLLYTKKWMKLLVKVITTSISQWNNYRVDYIIAYNVSFSQTLIARQFFLHQVI